MNLVRTPNNSPGNLLPPLGRSELALWLIATLVIAFGGCNSDSPARSNTSSPPAIARVEVVPVVSRNMSILDRLPAELEAWQQVAIYPKVQGFIEEVPVDRGSIVRKGQLLARLSAPELLAQTAQAEATTAGDQATYRRLVKASETPGATSKNQVELAEQAYLADSERVRSLKTLAGYLTITAPFDGIISERNVHPGALVGPPSEPLASAVPLLRLQEVSHLRLVVPVPQADADAVDDGAQVRFEVSAWPGRYFTAIVRRVSHSIDPATRTMPVEADYYQRQYLLDPGMFVEVLWPVVERTKSLFVPSSAIVQTATRTFVDVVKQGRIRQITVQLGRTMGDSLQVFGKVHEGDQVLANGSQDITDGEQVTAVPVRVHPPG
jgi:membrane fusion protein, multidrug efflux system